MKFISKSSNLLIVLRAGLSAQPITGTPSKPTVSVRFKDGIAEVSQQELIDMMLSHPAFGGDFISAETVVGDPYAATRQSSEPAHIHTEMKFGTPMSKVTKGGSPAQLPPELQKIVAGLAADMAKQMLPEMVKQTLQGIVEARGEAPTTAKTEVKQNYVGKKRGRKAKAKPVAAKSVVTSPEPMVEASNPAMQEAVS